MLNICAYMFLSMYVLCVECMDIYRYSKLYAKLIKKNFQNILLAIQMKEKTKKI